MTVLLTPADIKAICERPTKLRTYATADEYEMERYLNVAREAAIATLKDVLNPVGECPPIENRQASCAAVNEDCARCWLSYLKGRDGA